MSLLAKLFRTGEPPIDPAIEAQLDAFGRQMWDPFPPDWPLSKRQEALPGYVAGQGRLAGELLAELGLTQVDASALDAAWAHFLVARKLVKSGYKVPRHRRGHGRTDFQLTHREDLPSLRLLSKTAALFGLALQRMLPSLRWEVGHDSEGKYIHEGQPILRGFPGDFPEMNPGQVILNLAGQSIANPTKSLSEIAFQWVRGTTIPGLEEDQE
jgi:hypothetical protein